MATYDALHFIFKDYQLTFQTATLQIPLSNWLFPVKDHYENIGSEYGIVSEDGRTVPPEDLVNNLGFYVLGKKQFDKAADMFTMNVKNYPANSTAYNYLGDSVCAAKGDKRQMQSPVIKSHCRLQKAPRQGKKLEKPRGSSREVQ